MLKDVKDFIVGDTKVGRLVYGCIKDEKYCTQALMELKEAIKQKDSMIEKLQSSLNESNIQIEDLKKQIIKITEQLDELCHQNIGVSYANGKRMATYYREGMSLRKIAEIFDCDKSTVKRRLERLGEKIH